MEFKKCIKCGKIFFKPDYEWIGTFNNRKYCSLACCHKDKKSEDISGKKFGKLTAMKFVKSDKNNTIYWLFRCDCGNEKICKKGSVKAGYITSCGCFHSERVIERLTTHGQTNTGFYQRFMGILRRCNNQKTWNYNRYGGRGIKCLWSDFIEFKRDMYDSFLEACRLYGERYISIDRIDNDGNYCKANCRWVTAKMQAGNRRKRLTFIKRKHKH